MGSPRSNTAHSALFDRLDEIICLLRTFNSAERPKPCRLLRLKDAAVYVSLSPWKLRGLIQSGEIPVVRNGDGAAGVWLLDRKDLDDWVSRAKVTL